MPWLYLVLAGIAEIGMTTSMRYIAWPPKALPLIAFLTTAIVSFALLVAATWTIPLGTAYAIWTGIGAAGTVLVGIVWYEEPVTTLRLVFLTLLIGSIMGLKIVS
jgi:quaternary ammonium compound-resistance protein SugE